LVVHRNWSSYAEDTLKEKVGGYEILQFEKRKLVFQYSQGIFIQYPTGGEEHVYLHLRFEALAQKVRINGSCPAKQELHRAFN
jgi:hypothetical protein